MQFLLFDRMRERVERARSDSDVALFHDLLCYGELVLKVSILGLVASVEDEKRRYRYSLIYRLARADSLGGWAEVMEEAMTGPAAQHIASQATDVHRALNQRVSQGQWQYEAIRLLDECLHYLGHRREMLPSKMAGKRWVTAFVELRNKTRGHGALSGKVAQELAPMLEKSIQEFCSNFSLFNHQWAFLHQNLSGKYNVSPVTENSDSFNQLKSKTSTHFSDGIYVYFDKPHCVELLSSDVDLSDFHLANGNFNGKRYELLSYITGNTIYEDASNYLRPAGELPTSETQGLGNLDTQGNCFGNLPPSPQGYITRKNLESELGGLLADDRHPVITLYGPGGIGKTSLALTVLHQVTETKRFELIVWFSARDIELLLEGPKPVRPHILTKQDIAKEYARLVAPNEKEQKGLNPLEFLQSDLESSKIGSTLFVFDNFETVHDPVDLYSWIDTYIRLPNKVLITTRFREFKGDYPIPVPGMAEDECLRLIDAVSSMFEISELITKDYRQQLCQESDGHPYVVKILLGEVTKAKRLLKVERIVASSDKILIALFERTYSKLSPSAKRVFLTLCNWRSVVPLVGLKAVLIRPANEKMDVDSAVEELEQSSFVEIVKSIEDNQLFIHLPLAASEFGRRKLSVDPMKAAVDADCEFLRAFGAAQETDIRHGIKPRADRLFRHVAGMISSGKARFEDYKPVLGFVADNYNPAWLKLADLIDEVGGENTYVQVKGAILKYLEKSSDIVDKIPAWERLGKAAHDAADWLTEIHANVEMAQCDNIPFWKLSEAANRVNARFSEHSAEMQKEEKIILLRKLAEVIESRLKEADATDLSRLAWLHLSMDDEERARHHTLKGLELDPTNEYCLKLSGRFLYQ